MLRRFAVFILAVRWPLFLAILLFTFISALIALRLDIDPTIETLFVKDSAEYKYYREYRDRYGSDHLVVSAMSTTGLFTNDNIRNLGILTEAIGDFAQVESVVSLSNVMDVKHKFLGVKVVPALEGALSGGRTMTEVKEDILSNELYLNNLVSKDGNTANVVIRVKPNAKASSGEFIEKLRKLLKRYEKPGVKFYIAGSPVEQYDFIKLIQRDQFTFVPMITSLLMIMTFVIYRSVACVIVSISMVFATLVWTFGSIALIGEDLNLVTSLLAPVIMIITVLNSIHFMNLYMEIRGRSGSVRASIVMTIKELGFPCTLTHLTTIIGFISLAVNPVPAIRSFGAFSALGAFYSYIISMTFLPLMLPALPYRFREKNFNEKKIFSRFTVRFLERLEHRWKWLIIAFVAASFAFSLWGMSRLEIDTNIVKQLKHQSPLAVATRFIDKHLTGVYSLGFVFRSKDGKEIISPEKLHKLDDFKTYVETLPGIAKVNSITTLLKRINQAREGEESAYSIPTDADQVRRYFDGMAREENSEVWQYVSHDFKEARLQAQMKAVGTKEGALVEELARAYIEKNLAPYFNYNLTGSVVLLGKMAVDLVKNQMQSFVSAFVLILLLITIIFRSVKLGLLAAIPNLLPIMMTYGMMGFAGIELSMSTAMISSIVLGLVVDDSIHFLYRFRHEFMKRGHYLQALHHTYRHVGEAMTVSSLILIAGFATSIFAGFRPTMHFGLLTSLTIFLALLYTLLALPVWLILLQPFGRQKLFRQRGLKIASRED